MCHVGGRPGGVVTVLPAGSQQGRGRQPLIPEVPARPHGQPEALSPGGNPAGSGGGGFTRMCSRSERGLPGARALISCKLAPRATSHRGVGAGSWGCGEMLMVEQSVPRNVLKGRKDKGDWRRGGAVDQGGVTGTLIRSHWDPRHLPQPHSPLHRPASASLWPGGGCRWQGLQVAGAAGGRWAGSWNPQAFELPGHSPSCPNSAVARGPQGQSWPWQQLCSCPERPWVDPFVSAPGETPAGCPGGLGP